MWNKKRTWHKEWNDYYCSLVGFWVLHFEQVIFLLHYMTTASCFNLKMSDCSTQLDCEQHQITSISAGFQGLLVQTAGKSAVSQIRSLRQTVCTINAKWLDLCVQTPPTYCTGCCGNDLSVCNSVWVTLLNNTEAWSPLMITGVLHCERQKTLWNLKRAPREFWLLITFQNTWNRCTFTLDLFHNSHLMCFFVVQTS